MPSFTFEDQEIEFEPGEDILTAILKAGSFIPHYCYHQGLSRAATCRMCMVEITDAGNGRALPKLQTACSTPAADGMKITGASEKVVLARNAIMEFLLVNHPLDCPICDQAGECTLQEYSFQYGTGISQVVHEKRVYGWRDIGTFLQLERNRCIHCTRCVRFTQEISDSNEMGVFQRNHQLTVDTFIDNPLTDNYQGNLADICPVGAITLKDARFKKRVWKLKSADAVCDGCARGCNIFAQYEKDRVYRFKPRENQRINKWWMCDTGRVSFHPYFENPDRQIYCLANGDTFSPEAAFEKAGKLIRENRENLTWIVGSPKHSVEEQTALKEFAERFLTNHRLIFPKPAEDSDTQAFDGEKIKNLLLNDRTPNSQGLKHLGYTPENLSELFSRAVSEGVQTLILCDSGLSKNLDENAVRSFENIILADTFRGKITNRAQVSFPVASYLEKDGHFINIDGFVQKSNPAIFPQGESQNLCEILAAIAGKIEANQDFPKNPARFFENFAKQYSENDSLTFEQHSSEEIRA